MLAVHGCTKEDAPAGPKTPVKTGNEIGLIGGMVGDVKLIRTGGALRMVTGTWLQPTDEIQTGTDGKVRVLFNDDSVLSIRPRSKVGLTSFKANDTGREFDINVLEGRFKIAVAKWFLGDTNGTVNTPTAVAGVHGTVMWGDTERDIVCALEGQVTLKSKTGAPEGVALDAGKCGGGMKDGKTNPIAPTPEDIRKYLAEVMIP